MKKILAACLSFIILLSVVRGPNAALMQKLFILKKMRWPGQNPKWVTKLAAVNALH